MWQQRSYREQHQGSESFGGAGGTAVVDQDQDDQQAADEMSGADDLVDVPSDQVAEADDGEVVITIGDEAPPVANDESMDGRPAPQWLKDLRKREREQAKRIREFEQAEAARQTAAAPAAPAVGEKPTPEQFDFDSEAYGEALIAWNERKRAADTQAAAAQAEQEAAQAAWNERVTSYNNAKASLKVDDFDGAEHVVRETMSPVQQSVILNGADKPELLVYALGRNPAKAKELAAIKDPVKFAFAVAKLESQLKVAPRKAPPAPERQVRGTAGGATSVDNQLARLQAQADKTGDRSAVAAYMRKQKQAAA